MRESCYILEAEPLLLLSLFICLGYSYSDICDEVISINQSINRIRCNGLPKFQLVSYFGPLPITAEQARKTKEDRDRIRAFLCLAYFVVSN